MDSIAAGVVYHITRTTRVTDVRISILIVLLRLHRLPRTPVRTVCHCALTQQPRWLSGSSSYLRDADAEPTCPPQPGCSRCLGQVSHRCTTERAKTVDEVDVWVRDCGKQESEKLW